MLFNEIYSVYYKTVGKIIESAIEGDISDKKIRDVINENAFSESDMTIFPSIKEEKWQVVTKDGYTPIESKPEIPLSDIEKRWLKAISLDKRVQLFDMKLDGLEEIEPLFRPEDVVVFDQYLDGDNYEDKKYQENFKIILKALKEKWPLNIEMRNSRGNTVYMKVMPKKLEYSLKDDKFRLITTGNAYEITINLGRIISCERYFGQQYGIMSDLESDKKMMSLELTDERNALERVLLHFAHFEKQAEYIEDNKYIVRIWYDKEDESEILIRVLSFGPFIKVNEPNELAEKIKQRIKQQMRYL